MKAVHRRIVKFFGNIFLFIIFMCITLTAKSLAVVSFNSNVNVPSEVLNVCESYSKNSEIKQLLIISHTGECTTSTAYAYFYVKDENQNWELVFKDIAYIGKNGIGKTKEGDSKTPTGSFKIMSAFGILPNPGTEFPYTNITDSTYACDDDCEYYNKIIDVNEVKHKCNGEKMSSYVPHYNYGFATDYNSDCVRGLGSNIFVHCFGKNKYTGGCVELSEENMKKILTMANKCKIRLVIIGGRK